MGNKVINTTSVKLGIYETSTDLQLAGMLGDVKEMCDGRKFRLCENGTVLLAPGLAVQGPALNAYDEDMAIGTAAVGDKTLTVTVNASYGATVAADDFKDGYFCVNVGSGELGHGRKIKSNTEAAVGADTTLTFYDALTDTISAGSTGQWIKCPFKKVVIDAGTAVAVGVPVCDVAASTSTVPVYFWAQTSGPCPMVSGGALVAGDEVETSSGTAVVTDGATDATIGIAMQTCDSGDAGYVKLNID